MASCSSSSSRASAPKTFVPIYVLSGPSGRLFEPMADTTIFALIGSLIVTLTVIPVLCAMLLHRVTTERVNKPFRWLLQRYERALDWAMVRPQLVFGASS